MNRIDELVQELRDELEKMLQQYQALQSLKAENETEQVKIVDQNVNIKDRISELDSSQLKADELRKQLDEREKQILIKEKQNLLIDQKMRELQDRTSEVILQENKLKRDTEDYKKKKTIMDKQTEIYHKLEESDTLNKARLKLKEEELDKELVRLKNMRI